jgi:hypothetical protein
MRRLKLSSLRGLGKFHAALANDGLRDMVGWLKSKKKSKLLMEEVRKHIFDLGPPRPPVRRTGRKNYHQLLIYHLAEIQTTLDTMRDIEFYMGRFPYSEAKVARHRHLMFHVQAFLNELYILQQRLLRLLAFIERQHRKDARLDHIKDVCAVMENFVTHSMKKGVAIRGRHVHEWRLSDNDHDRLIGMSLYMMTPSGSVQKAFKAYYDSEYKRIRRSRREWVASGIGVSQELVDGYFDELFKLVFDGNGRLVYPSRLKF